MSLELIKSSARLFGGSAVAGMGFSFGRDIYRKATKKDTKNAILGFIMIALAVLGTYTGGVWLARNYQTVWGSIFKRIGSLFILAPSFVILLFLGLMFTGTSGSDSASEQADSSIQNYPELIRLQNTEATVPEVALRWDDTTPSMNMSKVNGGDGWAKGTQVAPKVWEFSQNKFYSLTLDFASNSFIEAGFDGDWLPDVRGAWSVVPSPSIASEVEPTATTAKQPDTVPSEPVQDNSLSPAAFVLPCGVLAIGLLAGFLQRGKRRLVWEAETANAL